MPEKMAQTARKKAKTRPGSNAHLKHGKLPESFCAVPFATLIFNPWGNVGSCREQGNQHSVGDVRKQTWQEIWNGERIRAWRREFLTGQIQTCKEHIRHRSCNKSGWNAALLPMIELSEIQRTPPKRISPDFNGHCNLSCGMCSVWKEPNGLYDQLGFWEDAEKNLFPYLKQVDPLAGEPFIQKDTYRLMDIMARVNPSCEWRLTTNAHWKFTPFIRSKLESINLKTLNISLDSINEDTYARIRKNGNLRTVLKTIADIVEYREQRRKSGGNFHITINTTVQVLNSREVNPFIRFVLDSGAEPGVQFLYEPRPLSLLALNEEARVDVLNYYVDTLDPESIPWCGRLLTPLLDSLPGGKAAGYRRVFGNIRHGLWNTAKTHEE